MVQTVKNLHAVLEILVQSLGQEDPLAQVMQWVRICLPMQGTQVRSLVGKIPHAVQQLTLSGTTTEAHAP